MKIPKRINPTALEDSAVIASAALVAKTIVDSGDGSVPSKVSNVPENGARFAIDLLIPEGVETGDAREFKYNSLSSRDFPLPLYWQIVTDSGHNGSVIVGRIDHAERLDQDTNKGWGNATGVFDTGPFGREAERLVRGGFLRGVSADLDKFEAAVDSLDTSLDEKDDTIKNDKITVTNARLMGATLLGKPAFQECSVRLIDEDPQIDILELEDGIYEDMLDDPELVESSLIASAAPIAPPREWFSSPKLEKPTPITVTDEGKVFGHIASWDVSHIGMQKATKPPRSHSGYAYFRTGVLRTDDGSDVPVGQITLAGGHASMNVSAAQAVKHYDDTASAIADVSAGEDQFGIWVSGSIRPDASPQQIRALRASAPSGDWRPINGRLELVAVCQVNVPGFPVARAMVAGGQMLALVAAGARPIAELRESELTALGNRVSEIERTELLKQREIALQTMQPLLDESANSLTASAASAKEIILNLVNERDKELREQYESAKKIIFNS